MTPVLVSACLLGCRCRYDGCSKLDRELVERLRREGCPIVPVCPEQLGGLSTPRPPAEITTGDGRSVLDGAARLVNRDGADVTAAYVRGAEEAVRLARLLGCRRACLKEKSPACGVTTVKRGEVTLPGTGVAAAMLQAEGIEVIGVGGGGE
jgi:uncharacterized protein YbbK (DUF523 family)